MDLRSQCESFGNGVVIRFAAMCSRVSFSGATHVNKHSGTCCVKQNVRNGEVTVQIKNLLMNLCKMLKKQTITDMINADNKYSVLLLRVFFLHFFWGGGCFLQSCSVINMQRKQYHIFI